MTLSRMKISRILCPTDFSDFSGRALARAVPLARWFEARITVAHVIPTPLWVVTADPETPYAVPGDLLRVQRQEVAEALERFVEPYRGNGVGIDTRLLDGDPSRVIQKTALALPADLVVMGTHGRGGFEQLLLGSVTEKVLRRATCPVLAVGHAVPTDSESPLFRRVLCPLDLTEGSPHTLEVALSLAEESMARITFLHVLEGLPDPAGPPRLGLPQLVSLREDLFEEAQNRLNQAVPSAARDFCSVSALVEEGRAWREVLRVAEAKAADLIVMGAHSGKGLRRAFFGSTVNQVVREARCPVLVVRETPARQPVRSEASSGDSRLLAGAVL